MNGLPDESSPYALVSSHIKSVLPFHGNVIECGVWRGGTTLRIAMEFGDELRKEGKKLYGCDTFGATHPALCMDGSSDIHIDARPVDLVVKLYEEKLLDFVQLVFGHVEVTLDAFLSKEKFSFAWLDVDSYHGTMFAAKWLKDRMVPGGIIGFHDYHASWSSNTVDAAVDRSIGSDDSFSIIDEREISVFFRKK
jgi:hypothetical protein